MVVVTDRTQNCLRHCAAAASCVNSIVSSRQHCCIFTSLEKLLVGLQTDLRTSRYRSMYVSSEVRFLFFWISANFVVTNGISLCGHSAFAASVDDVCQVAYLLFTELNFISTFRIPVQQFVAYFHVLELGYRHNPCKQCLSLSRLYIVALRPMSHLQFYRAILSRNFIARQNRKCDMPCRTLQLCRINKK